MGKIFEIVRPKSLNDADYEPFEYLIRWKGKNGADYLYMFYDAELQNRVRNEVINSHGTNIKALPSTEERSVNLIAVDLSLNDLEIIAQMFSCTFVTRLKRDSTYERYASDATSFKRRLMDGRYRIEFTLIMSDATTWK
jgi:hypothetical protein